VSFLYGKSLKDTLTRTLAVISSVALLLSCLAFIMLQTTEGRESVEASVTAVADMLAVTSATSLSMKDQAGATQILQAAVSMSSIASAAILTPDNYVFASYMRPGAKEDGLVPHRTEDGLSLFVRPILRNGEQLGVLRIRYDTTIARPQISRYLGIALGILLASSLLALLLASRLQRAIAEPIAQLARTMRIVSKDKNYSVRAYKTTQDELGELIDGFNDMLAQIQLRDAALEKAHSELENRMQERTSKLEQEIAERTRLEQQLLQAQKMEALGQLAGGIAHDFNNLLTVIMGNLSLARIQSGTDGKVASLLQAAEQGTHRASELTRQLLAVGRRTFNMPQKLDLHEVVLEVVQILRRTIDPRIVIETPASEVIWYVYADSGQMFQALMNLCVNARDAMPDGGRLRIALENVSRKATGKTSSTMESPPGSFVRLTVSDTGTGMDVDTCGRIFEPFFTTKEVGKGTGLGLAMVYGIVTQNKGTITVDSRPGRGSRFIIELPRYVEDVGPEEVPAALVTDDEHTEADLEGSGETILVVEDEDAIRRLARKVLEQLGYLVLEAEDGLQGVTIYEQEHRRIAAVILDLTMPKKSGLEVLASIRRLNSGARVILSSGYSAAARKLDLPALGVMAFLQKPYVPNELARTLRNVLDQKA
jgi:signal transduction histidine kinase/ActR/RegA family two-component response regulator